MTDECTSATVTVKKHKALPNVGKPVRWKAAGCGSVYFHKHLYEIYISSRVYIKAKDLMLALL